MQRPWARSVPGQVSHSCGPGGLILLNSIKQSLRLATEDARSQVPAHTDPLLGITRVAVVFALPWPVGSCFPGDFVNGLVCSQVEL